MHVAIATCSATHDRSLALRIPQTKKSRGKPFLTSPSSLFLSSSPFLFFLSQTHSSKYSLRLLFPNLSKGKIEKHTRIESFSTPFYFSFLFKPQHQKVSIVGRRAAGGLLRHAFLILGGVGGLCFGLLAVTVTGMVLELREKGGVFFGLQGVSVERQSWNRKRQVETITDETTQLQAWLCNFGSDNQYKVFKIPNTADDDRDEPHTTGTGRPTTEVERTWEQ